MKQIEREKRLKVLIKELHPTKNNKLNVHDLKSGSAKRLWWKCHKGHIWEAILSNRIYNSSGCPKCKKGGVFKLGLIIDEKPELINELHPTKNKNIKFHELTAGSEKRVWWICDKGHEWNTTAAQRYKSSTGCPYCAGKLPTKENNLSADNPQLSKQWDNKKNNGLRPQDFVPGSLKKVWWICSRGHSYEASIYNRNKRNQGCPKCHSNTSKFELRLLAELSSVFKNVSHQVKIDGYESDIFIPQYKIGIDYDGKYYHKSKKRIEYDKKKISYFKNQGITFFKVREVGLPSISNNEIFFKGGEAKVEHVKKLLKLIRSKVHLSKSDEKALQDYLKNNSFINEKLFFDFLYKIPNPKREKSLKFLHEEISREWHPKKNGNLTPDKISEKSNLKVWWKCFLGHEYQTVVYNRTIQKSGCPFCARKKISFEESLEHTHPKIANTWHPTKNGKLEPQDVFSGTSKHIWWICVKGHIWNAIVYSRIKHGCPFCSGNKTTIENSIKKTNPALAKEWHPTKNGEAIPYASHEMPHLIVGHFCF